MKRALLLFLLLITIPIQCRQNQYILADKEYVSTAWLTTFRLNDVDKPLFDIRIIEPQFWPTALYVQNPMTMEESFCLIERESDNWFVYSFQGATMTRTQSWDWIPPFAFDKGNFEILAFDRSDSSESVGRYRVLDGKFIKTAVDLRQYFNMTLSRTFTTRDMAIDEVTGLLYILIASHQNPVGIQMWQCEIETENCVLFYVEEIMGPGINAERIYVYNNTFLITQYPHTTWSKFNLTSPWILVNNLNPFIAVHWGEQNIIVTSLQDTSYNVLTQANTFSQSENGTISTHATTIGIKKDSWAYTFAHIFPSDCKDFCHLSGVCRNGKCVCDDEHFGDNCEVFCTSIDKGSCTESGELICDFGYNLKETTFYYECVRELPPDISYLPPVYEISRLHNDIAERVYMDARSGVLLTREDSTTKKFYSLNFEVAVIFDEQWCDQIEFLSEIDLLRNGAIPSESVRYSDEYIDGIPANVWNLNNSQTNQYYYITMRNQSGISGAFVDWYISTSQVKEVIKYRFDSFVEKESSNFTLPEHCLDCLKDQSRCWQPDETMTQTTIEVTTQETTTQTTQETMSIITHSENVPTESSITTRWTESESTGSSDEVITDQTKEKKIWQIISVSLIGLVVLMLVIIIVLVVKLKSFDQNKYVPLQY